MRQLQPVLWNKGALLQAQHLQTQDLYLESQLRFFMESLCGYPYGFKPSPWMPRVSPPGTSAFPPRPESSRTVCSSIFPIPIWSPNPVPGGRLPGRTGHGHGISRRAPVPGRSDERLLCRAGDHQYALCRRLAEPARRNLGAERETGRDPRKNLRYLLPHNDTTGQSVLPIARVVRKGDRLELDHTFVPPLLHVAASGYLVSILRKLAGLLAAKSQEQSQNRRIKNQGVTEYTASDTQSFWLLYTVNA